MRPATARRFKERAGLPTTQSMVRRLLSRLRTDQSGFTLVEQLVVAGGLIIIVGAIAGLMEVAQRVTPQDTARAHEVRDAQVGLDRMMRELRHASEEVAV